jgi:3-dehydroquinate synthase
MSDVLLSIPVRTMKPITSVRSNSAVDYEVLVRRGSFYGVADRIAELKQVGRILVITDTNVERLYAESLIRELTKAGFRTLKFVCKPGRRQKSLRTATEIFKFLFDHGADRYTLVLNVGGGTVGDLGGFVAALYLRGLRYIHIPTTLLSQADSGVGGKVNVNFGLNLNSLSVFHHPTAVWIDPDLLKTLPQREYLSGIAEIVKYAAILDQGFFEQLEGWSAQINKRCDDLIEAVIYHCIKMKCEIVSKDPKEQGPFRFFNYGHEIGHAIEVAYDYKHLLHGEAVSIGIMASSWIGRRAGLTDGGAFLRQETLLRAVGLPVDIPESLRARSDPAVLLDKISRILLLDKKRTPYGFMWIIPTKLGHGVCSTEIGRSLVAQCLLRLTQGRLTT